MKESVAAPEGVGSDRVVGLSPESIFHEVKPVIGMLHLRGDTAREKVEIAREEAHQLLQNGVDGVLVEDYFGDASDVERVLECLATDLPTARYGVNVLRDWEASLRLASRFKAGFVQLDSVVGHLPPREDEVFATRLAAARAAASVYLLGGVRFKHQPYLSGRPLAEDLRLATSRCNAVVVTGPATGVPTELSKIENFRRLLGKDGTLFVGAGMNAENCGAQLAFADGAIVGSCFKAGCVPEGAIVPAQVAALMAAVRESRSRAESMTTGSGGEQ